MFSLHFLLIVKARGNKMTKRPFLKEVRTMKRTLTGIMTLWLVLGLAVGQFGCLSGAGNKAMMGDDMQGGTTTMQNDAMKTDTMGDSMSGSTNTMNNDTMR
jgi:hypothetical protein